MVRTDPSRRRLLAGIVAAPLLAGASVAATRLGSRAAMLRPGARGGSSQRCAACGSWDHLMLDAACPAAEVRRT